MVNELSWKERSMWFWKEYKACTVHTWIWLLALSPAPVRVIKLSAFHFDAAHFGESLLTLRITAAIVPSEATTLLLFRLSHVWLSEAPWTAAQQASCPSPSPGACSNSCPLSQGCHPTISSSVIPFSCLQSVPASGSLLMSRLFASNGQSIGASASASVLPMNIQD